MVGPRGELGRATEVPLSTGVGVIGPTVTSRLAPCRKVGSFTRCDANLGSRRAATSEKQAGAF